MHFKVLYHFLNSLLWHPYTPKTPSCPTPCHVGGLAMGLGGWGWGVIKPSCRRPSVRDLRHLFRTSIQVWHTLARSALRDPCCCAARVSRKRKPLCQAAIAPLSPSPVPHSPTTTSQYLPFPLKPSTPRTSPVQSQGWQVNPNCMLIRALRTSP